MFTANFLYQITEIARTLDQAMVEKMADILARTRDQGGRLFILGVGGSAASASHAVNDFRKLAGFEAYSPVDNVSELTARTNDEGWETVFADWLRGSRLKELDALLIFSVGGGNPEKGVSVNLCRAIDLARERGAAVLGIVGRDGGYTARTADAALLIPTAAPDLVTPHTEAFHGVIWHLLVSHPKLKTAPAKW